ncbi:hypothetical protein NBO_73g0022 [Nosema bombycis CQ1]|uniref:MRG domain-containing protein n=1 Tax=Nosema bombycis (strain CQ1 / CVCC 102059) TaxID=578461 RepID=R0KRS2_NOSB1|nr:hypothetical protein NBO_73g0022 [Nosema bombycis CQ1]|eukprot:EOB13456.1 hypothetical protein NBO_73g0022 [Nosema bombycis CQ1]
MLHTTYEINQYVIFKYQDEWQEGRIIDVVVSDEKDTRTYYKVLSFMTLMEVPTLLFDHILVNNSENIKKITKPFSKIPLSKELRSLIEFDKEMISKNKIYKGEICMNTIFNDFYDFLCNSKCNLSKEEILLGVEGLKLTFNFLIEKVLKTQKEKKYYLSIKDKKEKDFHFGLIYGIRTVYYTLILEKNEDQEIRFIIYEYLIYFLDFCTLNLEKYTEGGKYD